MTVNPREYDAEELRELAGAEPAADSSSGVTTPATKPDESIRDEQFRQLMALQSERQQLDQLSRPFLTTLPESKLGRGVIDEWLDFLVHVGGQSRSQRALEYYQQLQWITPTVKISLTKSVDRFNEPTHDRSFTAGDHRLSLLYVATLASLT